MKSIAVRPCQRCSTTVLLRGKFVSVRLCSLSRQIRLRRLHLWSAGVMKKNSLLCGEKAHVPAARSNRLRDVDGQWRTKKKVGGFVVTFVVTQPVFRLISADFTYEERRGRESNPRLSSSGYGIPLDSQILSQFDLHLGGCLKRHRI